MAKPTLTHMPLDQATADPGEGFWDILVDRWWVHAPGQGLLFYGKSPQCNRHEGITRKIAAKLYPDAEIIFLPRVYVPHDCADYCHH